MHKIFVASSCVAAIGNWKYWQGILFTRFAYVYVEEIVLYFWLLDLICRSYPAIRCAVCSQRIRIYFNHLDIFNVRRNFNTRAFSLFTSLQKSSHPRPGSNPYRWALWCTFVQKNYWEPSWASDWKIGVLNDISFLKTVIMERQCGSTWLAVCAKVAASCAVTAACCEGKQLFHNVQVDRSYSLSAFPVCCISQWTNLEC